MFSARENTPGQGDVPRAASIARPEDGDTVDPVKPNTATARAIQADRLVAALRPFSAVVEDRQRTPTSLAEIHPLPVRMPTLWEHGFCRIDGSGRIRDAHVFDFLGWKSGDRITLEVRGEQLVVQPGDGQHIDGRGRITIPDRLRAQLGLGRGDGVLFSADVGSGRLVLSPVRICDQVVASA